MKYTMTTPCDQCPFLNTPQMKRGFRLARLKEFAANEFPCHQTASVVEDEDGSSEYLAMVNPSIAPGRLSSARSAG
jgi:hypothetical protein